MKTFKQYIFENSNLEDNLNKLMEMAWKRYKPEIKDFFDKLSQKDPDIRQILLDLENNEDVEENDVIAKNYSDNNFGNGEI